MMIMVVLSINLVIMLMMVVEASVEPSSPYPPAQLTVESFFVDQRFTCYDQIITNGSTSVAHSSLEQGVKILIIQLHSQKLLYPNFSK